MMQMLVRNKVKDAATWLTYFNTDADVAAEYGLTVDRLWQVADDPNTIYFILNVEDMDRANAFMARPESADVGEKSGVIDGDVQYLTPLEPGT